MCLLSEPEWHAMRWINWLLVPLCAAVGMALLIATVRELLPAPEAQLGPHDSQSTLIASD